jgi:transcriptional regulator with XRE-family HTH domain
MGDFGLRLQKLRKQRGLTQKMLAERINKSLSAVSSYETNTQMPPLDVLISIASVLNVSIDYLAGTERKEVFVIEGLSDTQKEVLYMLIKEFDSPPCKDKILSSSQKDILEKLLYIFLERE